MRILLVNDKEGLEYAPEALSFEKAGYDVENTTTVIAFGPRGIPRPVAERREKALVEAARMEPFVSVARKSEATVGEPLTDQALTDYLRKVSANYEELIKEAARSFFAKEFPPTRLREVEARGLAAFSPVYRTMGELGGGAPDIQRNIIAQRGLGLPRE